MKQQIEMKILFVFAILSIIAISQLTSQVNCEQIEAVNDNLVSLFFFC